MTEPMAGDSTVTGPMLLLRATEISGRPVVSIMSGEAIANVKDVLYSPEDGRLVGFTLNKRGGLFAGPMKTGLMLEQVHAVGRHAVTVESEAVLDAASHDGTHAAADRHRNVVGNDVVTDGGAVLGVVTDLVVAAGVIQARVGGHTAGEVVGYQLRPAATSDKDPAHAEFVPLPYTLAVSGTHLVVPASVQPFITRDLSGFGGAVEAFRAQLGEPPAKGVTL